jgi:hypothetical protein
MPFVLWLLVYFWLLRCRLFTLYISGYFATVCFNIYTVYISGYFLAVVIYVAMCRQSLATLGSLIRRVGRAGGKSGLCRQKFAQDFSFKILSSDFYILVLGF